MSSILQLTLLLILAIPQTEWISFTDPQKVYSVLVPEAMESKEQLVNTQTGDYLLFSSYLESSIDKTDNYLYIINYHEINEVLFVKDSLQMNVDFLHTVIEDLALDLEAEVLYTTPSANESSSIVEYRMSYGNSAYNIKGRVILTSDHLFSLQVYTNKQMALNRNIDRFLDSFRLL